MKEPATVITDFLLAVECFVLAVLLVKNAPLEHSVRFWAAGFVTTAIAAASGGAFHGWGHVNELIGTTLWKITVYAVGMSTALMALAGIFSAFDGAPRKVLACFVILQFVLYCAWMARHSDFRYVVYNYVPGMLFLLVIQILLWTRNVASAPWIFAGILISFGAAAVQQSGFKLHRHFNHNDLYHVIQMIAMYVLYRGGLLLRDRNF